MNMYDNTPTLLIQGSTATIFAAYLDLAYTDMIPWICAAVPLIIGDLIFGVLRVISKKEKIFIMRAIRMTITKSFTYACWIMISIALSITFELPSIKYGIMGFVYINELVSCFRNYLNAKGYNLNEVGMFKLLWKMIVREGKDLADEASELITKEKDDNGKSEDHTGDKE